MSGGFLIGQHSLACQPGDECVILRQLLHPLCTNTIHPAVTDVSDPGLASADGENRERGAHSAEFRIAATGLDHLDINPSKESIERPTKVLQRHGSQYLARTGDGHCGCRLTGSVTTHPIGYDIQMHSRPGVARIDCKMHNRVFVVGSHQPAVGRKTAKYSAGG